jgi:hypothetical protein
MHCAEYVLMEQEVDRFFLTVTINLDKGKLLSVKNIYFILFGKMKAELVQNLIKGFLV